MAGGVAAQGVSADTRRLSFPSPGLFRPSNATIYLRYANTQGVAHESHPYGAAGWLPVAGRFTP